MQTLARLFVLFHQHPSVSRRRLVLALASMFLPWSLSSFLPGVVGEQLDSNRDWDMCHESEAKAVSLFSPFSASLVITDLVRVCTGCWLCSVCIVCEMCRWWSMFLFWVMCVCVRVWWLCRWK